MIRTFHKFDSRQELADALAHRIVQWARAYETPGRLELSGGSTPKELLAVLSAMSLPAGLDVLPVDDRCVPVEHEHSNAGMLQAALGTYRARPLFDERRGIGGSVQALREAIGFEQNRPRFTILGLGPDGHTASLFPGSPDLPSGLDACASAFISAQPTMEPMVPRISMSAPFILAADELVLHFHGADKMKIFEAAQNSSSETYPIAHFLRHPAKSLDVYYAD